MLVSEFYKELDLEDLEEKADISDYHNSVNDFVLSVWDLDMDRLSEKQVNWLQRISDSN